MKFSNSTYDILKDVVQLWLPGLATLVIAIGEIWGLNYTSEIGATITALALFLGAGLKSSTKKYNEAKGDTDNED